MNLKYLLTSLAGVALLSIAKASPFNLTQRAYSGYQNAVYFTNW
jgi:hypothetical protein